LLVGSTGMVDVAGKDGTVAVEVVSPGD